MNDRDCENCVHKVNGACTAWECKFEPKRGITKEEAIEIIECGEISNRWGKDGKEIEEMAIKALKKKPSISEDGTLTVNVEDGSKVSRVLVCGDNHFGGLYYPEQEPCDKCVYSTSEGCQYDDITETIPPFEDCISRQAVLDITWEEPSYTDAMNVLTEVRDKVKELPPVNPQKPKSEWEHDHEILKAYSDGASAVLDKIRDEIEAYQSDAFYHDNVMMNKRMVLDIIDKYKAEGGDKE